ncbi:MAG: hypothetical protein KatS3mg087_1979 [Patescibacteria group bacterium]|nr:MAG: hypothetical protein KatS3mg087_1979 [Patescibacteria group bacterium]
MFKKYQKEDSFSYTLGYATTLDLLRYQPQHVIRVVAKSGNDHNSTLQEIRQLCNAHNIEYLINDRQIDRISVKENCYVIGFFHKYSMQLAPNSNHVVLVNPSDMGNLGTIIRAMLGFNHQNLIIIRPGCDFWAPKVIRGSMGALFQINIQYYDSFSAYNSQYPHQHFYPFILEGQTSLQGLTFQTPYSLIFGNEGEGLPQDISKIGTSIRIEHSQQIDSLNLAISVALALYQTSTQN